MTLAGTIQETWDSLQGAMSMSEHPSALRLVVYLAIGGVLSLFIRYLYSRYARSPMAADAVARVFPMLTLVTTGVIAVVKSSLALSLGLVGALSIVRFRAAIKDPEELVYLFLCIAVGLSLGAEQPLIALSMVGVATIFIIAMHHFSGRGAGDDVMLTIVGAAELFEKADGGALAVVQERCPNAVVQRCEVEDDEGQLRVQLHRMRTDALSSLIAGLRESLPNCRISYVNMSGLL